MKVRAALQSYLTQDSSSDREGLARPLVVDAPPAEKPESPEGFLLPSFERGALMLRDDQGQLYRLSWNEESAEPPATLAKGDQRDELDRRRALPEGKYMLVSYRLTRTDKEGERWDLSASHPKLRAIEVTAGETLRVEVSEAITIKHRLAGKQLSVNISAENVLGAKNAGLTIYRAGARIPVDFKLFDASGAAQHAGRIRYG